MMPGAVAEGVLVHAMHLYSSLVFRPYQIGKSVGLFSRTTEGAIPPPDDRHGLGAHFSKRHRKPVLLNGPTKNDALVEEFDPMGEVYGRRRPINLHRACLSSRRCRAAASSRTHGS